MINKPYDTDSVSPVETLLLGRMSAMELMLAGLSRILMLNLPTTKSNIDALIQQCGKSVETAEEHAAALFLRDRETTGPSQLVDILTGTDTAALIGMSLEDLLKLSEEPAKELDEALNEYLPKAGISSMMGDIGHPVTIGVDRFLAQWEDKMVELPKDPAKVLEVLLKHSQKGNAFKLFKSNLVNPAEQDEPLFILGNSTNTFLVIAPTRYTWHVLSFPNALTAPFVHRQARVLDLGVATSQIKAIFNTVQDAKLRAMLRSYDDATTKIQVLLTDIFQSDHAGEVDVNREELFHYKGVSGQHQQLKRVCIIQRIIDQNTAGLQLLFSSESTKQAFIVVGEKLVPVMIDDMEPQSKAIVVEVLTALAKKIKPPKVAKKSTTAKKK